MEPRARVLQTTQARWPSQDHLSWFEAYMRLANAPEQYPSEGSLGDARPRRGCLHAEGLFSRSPWHAEKRCGWYGRDAVLAPVAVRLRSVRLASRTRWWLRNRRNYQFCRNFTLCRRWDSNPHEVTLTGFFESDKDCAMVRDAALRSAFMSLFAALCGIERDQVRPDRHQGSH